MDNVLFKTQLSLDSNKMENEVLKHEMEGLKLDPNLAKLKYRHQQKQKLRVREANYMLKVKVMHLKSALRDAEVKLESLQDEGEDLRKEDTALVSDDEDYMEEEGLDGLMRKTMMTAPSSTTRPRNPRLSAPSRPLRMVRRKTPRSPRLTAFPPLLMTSSCAPARLRLCDDVPDVTPYYVGPYVTLFGCEP
jgi:hypothetical protein